MGTSKVTVKTVAGLKEQLFEARRHALLFGSIKSILVDLSSPLGAWSLILGGFFCGFRCDHGDHLVPQEEAVAG